MTQHIAFFGKDGVGKTTLATNLAAALAEAGTRVVLLGCDPKGGSGTPLHGRTAVPKVLSLLAAGKQPSLTELVTVGYRNIACIELGDVAATGECTASWIGRALELLRSLDAFAALRADCVIYDMPGATGCPGDVRPSGIPPVHRAFLVTSADLTSLREVNSLIGTVNRQADSRPMSWGLIANNLAGPFEESIVCDFARQLKTRIIGAIPRSIMIKQCEYYGTTVIEAARMSNLAYHYRRMARLITDGDTAIPLDGIQPLPRDELREWARTWGDRIGELEFGIQQDGGGI